MALLNSCCRRSVRSAFRMFRWWNNSSGRGTEASSRRANLAASLSATYNEFVQRSKEFFRILPMASPTLPDVGISLIGPLTQTAGPEQAGRGTAPLADRHEQWDQV